MSSEPAVAAPRRELPRFPAGRGWLPWAGAVAVLVVLALAPTYLLLDSDQRTLGSVFMFVVLAQGWNLIGGFAGYPSFGNVVFFGLGGYTTAVLMAKAGASFFVTVPAAAAVGAGFALLMGIPILRLRGHYFAIATLGVAEGTREVVINLTGLTGGGKGITIPAVGQKATTSYPGNTGFYFYFLTLAVITMLVVWGVAHSRFGYALRAIAQDEEAAAAAGINTTRAKIAAFALAGLLTSVAGAIYAYQQVSIYPTRLFSVDITVLMVVMAVFGGAGTVLGPMIGAVSLEYLSEWLRNNFTDYHTFVFGAIIVIAVLFLPMGVVNFARDAWRERRIALFKSVQAYRL
ncbi:MAG TPA: branched-chain amino acid ABC transporter permease [Thermoleophilaceae bacterium]